MIKPFTWQLIETAPKDGQPIILWDNQQKEPVVGKFLYNKWWINNSYGINEDGEIDKNDLTHWMSYEAPAIA